ncbi:MAG: PIN domain-containing protein [Pseudomonadota bacterium]|nr:PIN domain-containing protein [Pseudomonadota bacterium]
MIIVDTSVWSRAFRRPTDGRQDPAAGVLRSLIQEHQPVGLLGIVYQELLTGVRHPEQLQRLRAALDPFPLLLVEREDHLLAAEIGNTCRGRGIATSTPDALIAACTVRRNGTLLTSDRDFVRIADCTQLLVQFVPDEITGKAP